MTFSEILMVVYYVSDEARGRARAASRSREFTACRHPSITGCSQQQRVWKTRVDVATSCLARVWRSSSTGTWLDEHEGLQSKGFVSHRYDPICIHSNTHANVLTKGGRVIPMSFISADSISTSQPLSPFLLLVHHQHSFMPFDPTRTITNLFLPEGFPAHPHSGFSTVTITIDGGLKHRDSEGIIMDYGDGDTQCMTLTHSLMRLLTYSLTYSRDGKWTWCYSRRNVEYGQK